MVDWPVVSGWYVVVSWSVEYLACCGRWSVVVNWSVVVGWFLNQHSARTAPTSLNIPSLWISLHPYKHSLCGYP